MTQRSENEFDIRKQEDLLPFLLNPNSYAHRPRRVRLIQTHSSFVFIAPPFVFKIKKPVNFGFLDFSTLEKRRFFCEREVVLNQRLSPKMYLGVIPITRGLLGYEFGGAGRVVEYAVKMRKLSESCFLDELLRRNALSLRGLDRIAERLKEFYNSQTPTPQIEKWGRVDRIKISTDENFRQTKAFIGKTISKAAFAAISSFTNQFYVKNKRLFHSRITRKRILDCHGDLHLEHIHLTARELHIYDCIEFNDRFRYVDVANDVAFLAMDLDYHDRPALARHFTSKMARALDDPEMLRLTDFYKCYRAFVRGKVESLHSIAHAAPAREKEQSSQRAARYFRLALQYCVAGSEPLVLIVMGPVASGKSTLATQLSNELEWAYFSSDRIRKRLAGVPLFHRGGKTARQKLYSPRLTEKTYAALLKAALTEIKRGHCAIIDATFSRPEHRREFRDCFLKKGIRFRFIELNVPDKVIKARLRRRDAAKGEISDARLDDFAMLKSLYTPPNEIAPTEILRIKGTNANSILQTVKALGAFERA